MMRSMEMHYDLHEIFDWPCYIAPDYPDYEPAPRQLKPIKSAPLKINHTIKQPMARMGFRRGQRL